jgi:CRP-like cAMP-binding protein
MKQVLDLAIFDGCSRRQRAFIGRLGTTLVLTKSRQLCTQGKPGRQFVVILDGQARVILDGQQVATLHDGDCVGEISLLTGCRVAATATVEAPEGTTVWALSVTEFNDLIDNVPTVVNNLNYFGLKRAAANATSTSPVRVHGAPAVQLA